MIEKQKKENGEALISTVLFDNVSEVIHDRVPVQKVEPMTDRDYSVRGCTALLDATLSEMLGMTPNHLSAIERGASGISLEALQRLCRLLGVSADRIIFGTDEPEAEALALARRISDMKPEYRQQVQDLLSAILNMS